MPALSHETLQQESAHLVRAAANLFASRKCEGDLAELFVAARELRQSIADTLQRRAGELSKDDLVHLQSCLHGIVDEQFRLAIEKQFAQRVETLTRLAERDPLTGLPNRAAFEQRLRDESLRAHRYKRAFSVILFDVDGFKSVNDRFGHLMGDQVLAGVAHELQRSLRQSDLVFRYGGDEFIALCPETLGLGMETLLNRLENNLRTYHAQVSLPEGIGISWGVASFPADTANIDELIGLADQRLYECKNEHHRRAAVRT